MTVCIAAIGDNDGCIVMASDSRVSFHDFSSDHGAIKNIPLGNHYAVLVAGNDVDYALPTIKRIRTRMVVGMKDPDDVADIVHEELCATMHRKIEARHLSRFGFTTETFQTKGKSSLTPQVFMELCGKIAQETLSLQFLVIGFDANKEPHLRIVSPDDAVVDRDLLGFAAIGTGAGSAMSSLAFAADHLGFNKFNDVFDVAYHVLAAKFMAESATDVGKDTFFVAVGKEGNPRFLSCYSNVDPIRTAWLRGGAPQCSDEAIEIIKDRKYVLYARGGGDL